MSLKILHATEFYYPSTGGVQEVVRQVSERLVEKGHQVWVATSRDERRREEDEVGGVKVVSFDVRGNAVLGMEGEVSKYREFVFGNAFDVVVNFAAQQWTTDALLPFLSRLPSRKVFVPTGFSRLYDRRYSLYYRDLSRWIRYYDAVVVHSREYRDARWLCERGYDHIHIIPNGASEREFEIPPREGPRVREALGLGESFFILHVGSHTGEKGHREAIEIFRLSRIENSVLVIAGGRGPCYEECTKAASALNGSPEFRRRGKRIRVVELSRKETVSAFWEADLFLFPSNIECSPIVLYESLASATPFLSSDVGNAREIAGTTGGGVILPTKVSGGSLWDAFKGSFHLLGRGLDFRRSFSFLRAGYSVVDVRAGARVLEEVWKSPEKMREMGERGRRAWRESFTWDKIADAYERLYSSLCGFERHREGSGETGGDRE